MIKIKSLNYNKYIKMNVPYIIIDNYINKYKILKYIEKNYELILSNDKNLYNIMIINFDIKLAFYFNKIAKEYYGKIIPNFSINDDKKYSLILSNEHILEYLQEFYNKINYNIQNKLYKDFINYYMNQSTYLDKKNITKEYFVI